MKASQIIEKCTQKVKNEGISEIQFGLLWEEKCDLLRTRTEPSTTDILVFLGDDLALVIILVIY